LKRALEQNLELLSISVPPTHSALEPPVFQARGHLRRGTATCTRLVVQQCVRARNNIEVVGEVVVSRLRPFFKMLNHLKKERHIVSGHFDGFLKYCCTTNPHLSRNAEECLGTTLKMCEWLLSNSITRTMRRPCQTGSPYKPRLVGSWSLAAQ
jgi:hypothetical protein